jgi:hypothetical protein
MYRRSVRRAGNRFRLNRSAPLGALFCRNKRRSDQDLGIYRDIEVRDRNRFYVEEAGPSDVAEFFIQCHLRENLIHSRFNVSGTLLTLCVERADQQAGEED